MNQVQELSTSESADEGKAVGGGRRYKTLLKAAGSALLVALVLTRVDVRDVVSAGAGAKGWLVLLAASLHLVGYLVSAVRWRILLAGLGADVPLGTLVSSYLVGSFFNSFLPTTVGGDVVRIWDTARHAGGAKATAAVLVERATGVGALLVMAGAALAVSPRLMVAAPAAAWMAAGFAGVGIALVLMARRVARRSAGSEGKLHRVLRAVSMYATSKRELIVACVLGVVLQLNVALHYYILSEALGQNVTPLAFLLITPVLMIVLMLPVSINGIGLREVAFIQLMGPFGVSAASAVALSVLSYLLVTAFGLIGGVVYVLRQARASSRAAQPAAEVRPE